MSNPILLPAPRHISFLDGIYPLKDGNFILLDANPAQNLIQSATRLQGCLQRLFGIRWSQTASPVVPAAKIGAALRIVPQRVPQPQGYRLHVKQDGITIEGHDPAGVFYGVCTLIQLLEQAAQPSLQAVEVQDWPDFASRGVMLDISRDRVYRMDYLFALVDRLAGWKINQVQLYTEHTFAYQQHPLVWEKSSPMTGEEILALDAYCRERYIELVPNQNSFGHMERWLIHAPYADLAETHAEFQTPWGTKMKGPFSIAPENPGSLALISSLYDELLPHFTSRQLNVGCDETVDLGAGVSRQACEERGTGRVYLDFLLKVYANVKQRGYTMQFWGDIINGHPELVAELPRDIVAMEWGYDADHPFDRNCARYSASGIPFYVCPGTSTWCSLAGRTENALANLLSAADNGHKNGAIGYLNTDWGDSGHWQTPPASYLGFVMGAAYSWALDTNRSVDPIKAVSQFAFDDPSGSMGQVAYDLGNIYSIPTMQAHNSSPLFWALQRSLANQPIDKIPTQESTLKALEAIDKAMAPLASAKMGRLDADLIRREFVNTARLMKHAARRILFIHAGQPDAERSALAQDMYEIMEEYRALWLARSRPGGLPESIGRLEAAARDYLG